MIREGQAVIVYKAGRGRYGCTERWPGVVVGHTPAMHRVVYAKDGCAQRLTTASLHVMDQDEEYKHRDVLNQMRELAPKMAARKIRLRGTS